MTTASKAPRKVPEGVNPNSVWAAEDINVEFPDVQQPPESKWKSPESGRGRRKTNSAPIPISTWIEYQRLRDGTVSRHEAVKHLGISYKAATDFDNAKRGAATGKWSHNAEVASAVFDSEIQHGPKRGSEISVAAARCLDDIEEFALRYFGYILMPWQKLATQRIVELFESPNEEYVVINVAPGSGKTTFFVKVLPAWLTCRDRTIRGMIGSHTFRLSEWNTRSLRNELGRVSPVRAEARDLKLRLAVDAKSTMMMDYGRFQPDNGDMWRADSFVVAQIDEVTVSDKEPTWSAFGMDSGFLGGRFDVVIWDDLWDPRKMRNVEKRDEAKDWYINVAETRLEPGGLLILQGQRLAADDIYRFALDLRDVIDMDEEEGEVQVSDRRKYHHIVFKAHDETKCQGKETHKLDAAPWPEGCLLYPRRLGWKKLRTIRENHPDQFAVLYQQEDTDPEHVLVNPVWISGGTGSDGVTHVGCWDNDRDLWEFPRNIEGPTVTVATADPSPTNFWAMQVWHYSEESDYRWLIESYRKKMDAPSFLDWNHSTQRFSGLAEDWWQICKEVGHPIQYWVIEANAAQKFILQYDHFKRWSSLRNIDLIPHYTHGRNKGDPNYGVQMLGPLYKQGKIRLPGKSHPSVARPHSLLLINEVTHWTPDLRNIATEDCVMAQWFFEHNLENLRPAMIRQRENSRSWRPSWLKTG